MLNIKAFGIAFGALFALAVAGFFLIGMGGYGTVPYQFINQMYFDFLPLNGKGLLLAALIAFADGFLGGALFAWIYNKVAKA